MRTFNGWFFFTIFSAQKLAENLIIICCDKKANKLKFTWKISDFHAAGFFQGRFSLIILSWNIFSCVYLPHFWGYISNKNDSLRQAGCTIRNSKTNWNPWSSDFLFVYLNDTRSFLSSCFVLIFSLTCDRDQELVVLDPLSASVAPI